MLIVIKNLVTNLHKRFYTIEDFYKFVKQMQPQAVEKLLRAVEIPFLVSVLLPNWELTENRVGNEYSKKA